MTEEFKENDNAFFSILLNKQSHDYLETVTTYMRNDLMKQGASPIVTMPPVYNLIVD